MSDLVRPGKPAARKSMVVGVAPQRGKPASKRRAARGGGQSEGRLSWSNQDQALRLFQSSIVDRVNIVKDGVPARYVTVLTGRMGIPKDRFYRTLGLMRPTIDRKVRASKLLNQDESERVVGIARLVGQAQSLVQESGGSGPFDAARWVAAWLDQPLPALGGKRPGEFMDTADGRGLVADLLAQQQSGAYA
jgi:putative toxin-antitoxin system antitoxin component (TIGR02293 family)